MRRIVTIGVYDWAPGDWLAALHDARVRRVLDVRQRRGVRGPQYAWANSRRLQVALAAAGIEYRHHPELAPTTGLRHLQYAEDARRGEGKRSRTVLAPAYVEGYTREILDRADLEPIVGGLPDATSALFCVEADPEACHRSLIAARLQERFGLPAGHLRP